MRDLEQAGAGRPAGRTAGHPGARRAGEGTPGRRCRALFVTAGSFSHINAQLLQALRAGLPDVEFDTFGVSAALQRDYLTLCRCGFGAVGEYGLPTLAARPRLRYRLFRSVAYYNAVRRRLVRGFGGRGYDFTLQTQSLFSAALPGCPNFIYTDHAARARLAGEDGSETGAPSEAWLACERQIYEEAAHVFTFGPKIRDCLEAEYGIAAGKVSAIGAGASVTPEQPPDTGAERYARRNILFVGVEWERKGGPELVAAFRALRQRLPEATLTIIGCAPEVSGAGIEVLGRLPMAELGRYFRRAACFCMPSRIEPFGIVFLEAMQFGLPVVSTTAGDIGAIVRDGETGRLVAPGDSAALSEALYQVLAEPERCRGMALAGLARGQQFTWQAVVERIAAHVPGAQARAAAQAVRW